MDSVFVTYALGVISRFAPSSRCLNLCSLIFVFCLFISIALHRQDTIRQQEQAPLLRNIEGPILPSYNEPSDHEQRKHVSPAPKNIPPAPSIGPRAISSPSRQSSLRTNISSSQCPPALPCKPTKSIPRTYATRTPRTPLKTSEPQRGYSAHPPSPSCPAGVVTRVCLDDTSSLCAPTPIHPSPTWARQSLTSIPPTSSPSPDDSPLPSAPSPSLDVTTQSPYTEHNTVQEPCYRLQDPPDFFKASQHQCSPRVLLPSPIFSSTSRHGHEVESPLTPHGLHILSSRRRSPFVQDGDTNSWGDKLSVYTPTSSTYASTLESPIRLRVRDPVLRPEEVEIEILTDGTTVRRLRNRSQSLIGTPFECVPYPYSPDNLSSYSPSTPEDELQDDFFPTSPSPSSHKRLSSFSSNGSQGYDDLDEYEREHILQRVFVDMQRLPANRQHRLWQETLERCKMAAMVGSLTEALLWLLQAEIHRKEMERLNQLAAFTIFIEKNKNMSGGEVDLHGLYVKEALYYAARGIECAMDRGDKEVRFIVGKGKHAPFGISRLKPAVKKFLTIHELRWYVAPYNQGVLVVHIPSTDLPSFSF